MSNFKPLGDRILVKTESQSEKKSSGGIILNDSVMRGQLIEGKVVSVGTGIFSQTGDRIPITVKVGDTILFKKDGGGEIIKLEGEEFMLFREHELIGIL